MNHSHKCALALALLTTQTHPVCPIDYKNIPLMASAGIATIVTGTMLYNFFYPESAQAIVDKAVNECQSIKTLHNDISFIHENELMIVDQESTNATHTEIANKIKREVPAKYDTYSLYRYVKNLDYEISQLQEKMQELTYMQTNLVNRTAKTSDDNELLAINVDNTVSEIQTLRAELKDLITKLFAIRTHVASTPEYAYELKQYRTSEEPEEDEECEDRYASSSSANDDQEKTKAAAPVTAPETTSCPAVRAAQNMTFDREDWCDKTNPFNS